uniref:(northern house mosquito) hypothetical protein n=1 Tax=Culex pipiens TaxID=7175 RepID=A0A8D8BEJ6_CULPI
MMLDLFATGGAACSGSGAAAGLGSGRDPNRSRMDFFFAGAGAGGVVLRSSSIVTSSAFLRAFSSSRAFRLSFRLAAAPAPPSSIFSRSSSFALMFKKSSSSDSSEPISLSCFLACLIFCWISSNSDSSFWCFWRALWPAISEMVGMSKSFLRGELSRGGGVNCAGSFFGADSVISIVFFAC